MIVSFDNPGIGKVSAINFDFGVPNYFDHFGTFIDPLGATLTIEAVRNLVRLRSK